MSPHLQNLFKAWERSLPSFNVKSSISQAAFKALTIAYSSPDRYYHNLQRVLTTIATLHDRDSPSIHLARQAAGTRAFFAARSALLH